MTKKHLQFCIYYMQVGDPQVAYKMTYPRAAVKSLKASVSRLMARPDVAEWVNGTEERVHNRMMRKFYSEHYDKLKEQLLTINEKRTVLTKIIKGETKRVRYIKGKYGMDRVEEDLPVYAVLRAVDLDTRLENFYNYLTRSDTWRKAQNIYVNTPTLQQQVNILISQTNQKEEGKDTEETVFPIGRGTEGDVLAQDTHEPLTESPLEGDRGTLAQEIPPLNLAQRSHEQMRVTQEVPHEHGAEDVHSRGEIPPCKEVAHERVTEDVPSRGTFAPKKTPHFLTRVNKIGKRKTSNTSIPPPARTSPPPPAGDKANTNEPTGVYNQLQCIGSGDVSLRST